MKKESEFQGGLSHPPSRRIPIGSEQPGLEKSNFQNFFDTFGANAFIFPFELSNRIKLKFT
jgi:hypothetical protein